MDVLDRLMDLRDRVDELIAAVGGYDGYDFVPVELSDEDLLLDMDGPGPEPEPEVPDRAIRVWPDWIINRPDTETPTGFYSAFLIGAGYFWDARHTFADVQPHILARSEVTVTRLVQGIPVPKGDLLFPFVFGSPASVVLAWRPAHTASRWVPVIYVPGFGVSSVAGETVTFALDFADNEESLIALSPFGGSSDGEE